MPNFEEFTTWFLGLEWTRLLPELIGKALGFFLGFAASWFFLFRKRLKELRRFQQGDSDDVLFQAHYLLNDGTPQTQLVFRNLTSKLTVNQLYDNPAARELVRALTERTSLNNPVLPTVGTMGFEVLNEAASYVAGSLATSPHRKQLWLFCMTCEDRALVRRRCIRCFLIQPELLQRFASWSWVSATIRVERPWHWFRLVALHRIALARNEEERKFASIERDEAMPLVDDLAQHRKIMPLSLGLPENELAIAEPYAINWSQHAEVLKSMGVRINDVAAVETPAQQPVG